MNAPLLKVVGLLFITIQFGRAGSDLPLDRPYSLRNTQVDLVAREHRRLIGEEAALSFIFPRPCLSPLDSSRVCDDHYRISFSDPERGEAFGLHPVLGEEYRYSHGNAWATDGGLILWGEKGSASFDLDARLFTESDIGSSSFSYDREDVDVQKDGTTGTVSYRSFARYRGGFHFQSAMGRFSVARDAAHWGPGVFGNLSFNQDAVPFNQFRYTASLGPLTVMSLYGDLLAGSGQAYSQENLKARNLYAHRYELRLGQNALLGLTDRLILYDQNKAYLFAPIFPLFIAKGSMYEEANNGDLAMDATYRIPEVGMVYGEFLLDDLESPSSLLLKSYVQNKWACMGGIHLIRDIREIKAGFIGEYTRVEPWVYTHFEPHTSQAANMDYPLGNPLGPNSQSLTCRFYAWWRSDLQTSVTGGLVWKGTDSGSSINDRYPQDGSLEKVFLRGVDAPSGFVDFSINWVFRGQALFLAGRIGNHPSLTTRAQLAY